MYSGQESLITKPLTIFSLKSFNLKFRYLRFALFCYIILEHLKNFHTCFSIMGGFNDAEESIDKLLY